MVRTLESVVTDTMDKHLKLASRYERVGNAVGAANLRTVANMLGMMLTRCENIPPFLPDLPDDDIRPRSDGFDAYWELRGEDAKFLVDNTENGLKDALHDAWAVAQHQQQKGKQKP